jgi:hypothetical protein
LERANYMSVLSSFDNEKVISDANR